MAYGKDTVELARRMFVKDGLDVEVIAGKLEPPVSVWTIKNWKDRGQWEYEKKRAEDSIEFAEDALRLTAFWVNEIDTLKRAKQEPSKTQIELLRILTGRVYGIMQIDLELKKLNKSDGKMEDIPEEVSRIPRVQEAILVINKAISEYNRKKESE